MNEVCIVNRLGDRVAGEHADASGCLAEEVADGDAFTPRKLRRCRRSNCDALEAQEVVNRDLCLGHRGDSTHTPPPYHFHPHSSAS
eukprot:CAMPEP_0183356422 /NCGR_PEP_ID=MMETSP0164_2-20130417/44290_1 /TAXON_ID=221442 /ORGANISM="Coccolithus pelagicus ssp braarudi, Strain PLY182g" /LENGTH=85 /DNA_ID=CAMNT_0025529827 /DNA_START=340 /DNA_END=594 /DNA_ORIENTATION=+